MKSFEPLTVTNSLCLLTVLHSCSVPMILHRSKGISHLTDTAHIFVGPGAGGDTSNISPASTQSNDHLREPVRAWAGSKYNMLFDWFKTSTQSNGHLREPVRAWAGSKCNVI